MTDTGIITTYESGVDLVVEWKIENFFNLPETDGTLYWRPDFSFGGERWRLGISPNGSSVIDSFGHVGLVLSRRPSDHSIKQSFSLSLKTAEGEKYNEQHFSEDFDNDNYYHIFNRLIPRSELSNRRSNLVPEGTLMVICTMKSSTLARSANNSACVEICTSDVDSAEGFSDPDFGKCCHCKENFATGSLLSHLRKCMQRPIKCPDCLEVIVLQKWLDKHECQQERPKGEGGPTAEVNKSDVAGSSKSEASGSSEAGTTTTKESVLKWIKENCTIAPKERKRKWKTEKKNVLKWIEENLKEISEGKKMKMEEENAVGKLLQDLKGMMVNGDHSDVTVSVRGEEFRLHRSILGVRNPFFGMRFNSESQETAPVTLSIEDCDPDQFRTLIHYIYTGMADNLCPENVCGLFDVAVVYQEQQMRAECLQLLMNTLSVDNFCDFTSLAVKHDLEELLQKATELFVRKVKEITRREKWEAFLEKYPAQTKKLYMKALEQYDTK